MPRSKNSANEVALPSKQELKIIVGLGNPGKRYEWTRHNAGFLVVDSLLKQDKSRSSFKRGRGPFEAAQFFLDNSETIILAKPALFMNESGNAVKAVVKEFRAEVQNCLIVVDDVNLELGKIRFRSSGSAGGHHGLESIIGVLGTNNFPRLRIGVGVSNLSGQDISGYVLEPFSDLERKILLPQIAKACDACFEWVQSGSETVMRRYN